MSDAKTPKLLRQETTNNWLMEWLKLNNLEHLYTIIQAADVNIELLSESNEMKIRETASYKLKLTGNDLSSFVSAVIKYNNLQCLMRRNDEVSSCIDKMEYTKNELDIKRGNDVLYVQEKFKKIQKIIKKRESILIREITKKMELKKNLINEQISILNQYKNKLQKQHNSLINAKNNKTKNNDNDNNEDDEYGKVDENMNAKVLLNEHINYNKDRFTNINKTSVEIPNYDDIISQIKRTGIILDEFDFNDTNGNNKNDDKLDNKFNDKLDCLCGTQLILTNVGCSYDDRAKIFCNFCNTRCTLPYNGDIYHCPKGDIKLHPGGFDLCYFCGSKCFEARKAEKRRKKNEKKQKRLRQYANSNDLANIKKGRKYKQNLNRLPPSNKTIDLLRHNRSYSAIKSSAWEKQINDRHYVDNFMYPSQLKKVMEMGYDQEKARKLIIKHKGNMKKVMQELIT